jgi:hypothetical protein
MTIKPNCIITGCDIQILMHWQHGDLWELADCYIFNAVGDMQHGDRFSSEHNCLLVQEDLHHNYFERRNLFVVAKAEAQLNPAAQAYLARGRS